MEIHLAATECHLGSHNVTFHPTQVNTPRPNPSQTGQYLIYLPRAIEARVDLGDRLHTKVVYPTDRHLSKY